LAAVGCGSEFQLPSNDEGTSLIGQRQLTQHGPSYVLARRDTRKCAYPACGGYFVREMNAPAGSEIYVRDFEFDDAGLDTDSIKNLKAASPDEWAFLGVFGVEDDSGTMSFLVDEAFQGMPGVRPAAGESFSLVEAANVACIREPCPNLVATELNSDRQLYLHAVDASNSARTLVDQRWISHSVAANRAIAAAAPVVVNDETRLNASQVYLRLPFREDPCPRVAVPVCENQESNIFVRNDSRCLIPQGCAVVDPSPGAAPPCDEGYTQVSWIGPEGVEFACDPAFIEAP